MRYRKEVTLKDGTTCLIKQGEVADAQGVLDCFILTRKETDNLASYADEHSMTAQDEGEHLTRREESENAAELCAMVDGRVVGMAGIWPVGERDKLKHRAGFGIGIERAWWGKGLGREMTAACIECARKAGFLQLELEVVSDNAAAISLYESMGFRECGRNPLGFRLRSGHFQELVAMRLEL